MSTPLQPTNRFVAMFDVIGFKALRAKKGTAGLHQQFARGMLPAIQHSAAGKGNVEVVQGTEVFVPDFARSIVSYRAISDTVIFLTPDDTFSSFLSIINSAFMLLQFGFSGGKAPYRGAIGWGDLIDDPLGILLGSAVEDAYVGESSQAWAGAMLTQACRDFAERSGCIRTYRSVHVEASNQATDSITKQRAAENAQRLVQYPVPVYSNPKDGPAIYGEIKTYAIDWTIRMYENASTASFNLSSSAHDQLIAQNTQRFELWARGNNR